ncbi:MAG TPA: glucose 1-dehydrogenase [Bryobacteraceae bacterium]|nr:glucose 1-dehydrogenase [Bryobacteraceae bacterium]
MVLSTIIHKRGYDNIFKETDYMSVKDRVAVVTGGGTGIGRAIAEHFAGQGARVVVNYHQSREAAEQTVLGIRSSGGTAVAIGADISRQEAANALMAETLREFGRLDYLINNAGWSQRVPHARLEDLTDEIWNRVFETNLRGAFYCVRAAVPSLQQQSGAAIVNIASVAALLGQGSSMAYAASKGGLVTLTKSLARALAPDIRVNAVLPGFVRTRFAGWPESAFAEAEKITPLRRLATGRDVAEAALFFAAYAMSTTGETLVVDGGIAPLGPSL